jgi:spore germination protein KB
MERLLMKVNEKSKFGMRELIAIIYIVIGSKFTDMTPTMLFQTGENASWMIPIISILIMTIPLWFLYQLLKNYRDKNLVEIARRVVGSKLGFFIGVVLFVTALVSTIIDTRSYTEIIGTLYYPSSPIIALYFIYLVGAYLVAIKGISGISRVSWSIFPYVLFSVLLLIFFTFKEFVFFRTLPILGPGPEPILKESIIKVSIFAELIFFGMLYPFIKNEQSYKKGTIFGAGLSVICISCFIFLYSALFDFPTVQRVSFPFHEMARYASVGDYITNTETFYLTFWLLASIVKYSIYLYITILIFSATFKIKNQKKLFPLFSLFIFFVGLLPKNTPIIMHYREMLLHTASLLIPIIPVLLWIIAKWRGEFKR